MSERRPTPGIERMPRAIAERHFSVRMNQLREQIQSLPPTEMLMVAVGLLREDGSASVARMAASISRLAADKLEAAERQGE